jgi:hypothetical protein
MCPSSDRSTAILQHVKRADQTTTHAIVGLPEHRDLAAAFGGELQRRPSGPCPFVERSLSCMATAFKETQTEEYLDIVGVRCTIMGLAAG